MFPIAARSDSGGEIPACLMLRRGEARPPSARVSQDLEGKRPHPEDPP